MPLGVRIKIAGSIEDATDSGAEKLFSLVNFQPTRRLPAHCQPSDNSRELVALAGLCGSRDFLNLECLSLILLGLQARKG